VKVTNIVIRFHAWTQNDMDISKRWNDIDKAIEDLKKIKNKLIIVKEGEIDE